MGIPNKQPNLTDFVKAAIDAAMNETHTCAPGIIESFDASTQTAKVNLSIRRVSADRSTGAATYSQIPPVINVPVVFPSAGGYSITFPVTSGDEVLVVFSERAIDTWLQSGGIQDPLDYRKHDYTDAIAIIGLHSNQKSISGYSTDALEMRTDDRNTSVSISSSKVVIDVAGSGGATYNQDGSIVFANGAQITAAGDFVNASGTTFGTHIHSAGGSPPISGS